MTEYHKINSPFDFDMTTKSYKKELSSFAESVKELKWLGSEKIDGTNIRVHFDKHKFSFAGRTDNAVLHPNLVKRLEELFIGGNMEVALEQQFAGKEVTFYGEGYGGKVQNSEVKYKNDEDFIVFDIAVNNIILSREYLEGICNRLCLTYLPVMEFDNLEEAVELVRNGLKSSLNPLKTAEGIVVTPKANLYTGRGERIVYKIKTDHFNNKKL